MNFKCLQFPLKDIVNKRKKIAGMKRRIYCAEEITFLFFFFFLNYENAKFFLAVILPLICIFNSNSPSSGHISSKPQNL